MATGALLIHKADNRLGWQAGKAKNELCIIQHILCTNCLELVMAKVHGA